MSSTDPGNRLQEDTLLAKWNQRHAQAEGNAEPARVLLLNRHLLPSSGTALDLACGRGANALLLAEAGLQTTAWDFSEVAIEHLDNQAKHRKLALAAQVRDVIAEPPEADSFNVIVVSYFLSRTIVPALIKAVRPGGLLFYETFSREAVSDQGPSNNEWRLENNELLRLFSPMRFHYYREEAALGDTLNGLRDVALMVASKTG